MSMNDDLVSPKQLRRWAIEDEQVDKPEPAKDGAWKTGDVEAVEKKAMRFDSGKIDLTYLLEFPQATQLLSLICMYGEYKYNRGNFKLGGKPDIEYFKSGMRHLQEFYTAWAPGEGTGSGNGEDIFDTESGLNHLGHVVWNLMTFIELNLPANALMTYADMAEFQEHLNAVREKFAENRKEAQNGIADQGE